jgi:hypothetical protein
MLNQQRARNPLAAERSPRNGHYGFDPNPPPPQYPEKPRWNYPENDWGLMAKFGSQKQIYEQIYEREKSQKQVEQEISRLRAKNLEIIENELQKRQDQLQREKDEQLAKDREFHKFQEMVANPQKYSHMNASTHQRHHHHHYEDNDEILLKDLHARRESTPGIRFSPEKLNMKESSLFNKYGKSSKNQELLEKALNNTVPPSSSTSSLHQTKRQTKKNLDLYEKNLLNTYKTLSTVPVANIRSLQEDYPEVLKQYRTERAAEFISKQGNSALKPPPERNDLGTVAFRPGGILPAPKKAGDSTLKKTHSKSQSLSDISLPLDILTEQLKKTEDEIAYQRVKIGLNKKPTKTFEKSSTKYK